MRLSEQAFLKASFHKGLLPEVVGFLGTVFLGFVLEDGGALAMEFTGGEGGGHFDLFGAYSCHAPR